MTRHTRPAKPFTGMTLIEMLVVTVVVMVLFGGLQRLLSMGWRGSQQAQETIDHARTTGLMFRYLDRDLRGYRPTGAGLQISNSGSDVDVLFTSRQTSGPAANTNAPVRYTYRASSKEARRQLEDASGNPIQISMFGTGECLGLTADRPVPDLLQVTVQYKGKLKESSFSRYFSLKSGGSPLDTFWLP